MINRITHHFTSIETMRMEVDIAREYLRKAEDSIEIGQFTKAEAMTVQAIIHLKNILRELGKRKESRIRTHVSKWIV